MANKKPLQVQVNEILEKAEQKGVQTNFFFRTTFKRYQVQMQMLTELEKAIDEHGATVTKEYVKGRQNLVVNPAISEYNKTTTAANNTVATLIKIIDSFEGDESNEGLSSIMDKLMGDE